MNGSTDLYFENANIKVLSTFSRVRMATVKVPLVNHLYRPEEEEKTLKNCSSEAKVKIVKKFYRKLPTLAQNRI